MTTETTDKIRDLATRHGFLSGTDCGYRQEGLWLTDDDGGGHTSVYPSGRAWTVAFFGPGQDVPFAARSFPNAILAFRHATS